MKRRLIGGMLALTVLGSSSVAFADPSQQASCAGTLSAVFAHEGARDDIQLLHNAISDAQDVPPGQGIAGHGHAHPGSLAGCVQRLPPGLVVPPHPTSSRP